MINMVKIDCFHTEWDSSRHIFVGYKVNGKAQSLLIATDTVKAVSPEPKEHLLYESYDALHNKTQKNPETVLLHHLTTSIAVGRGINGVSFDSFDITEETYKRLIAAANVI